MSVPPHFTEIAALAGDPARASMLMGLMDGRALTATELASIAGITPQTASGHLAKMVTAGLLALEKQGRHRYHRLASPLVAKMLESISEVATAGIPAAKPVLTGPRNAEMRAARTCYDHLAGTAAVALADALIARGFVEIDQDSGLVTPQGLAFFEEVGLSLSTAPGQKSKRVMCRPCLDWSERRPHIAGALGAAIYQHSLKEGWVRRRPDSRTVIITPIGRAAFQNIFGAEFDVEQAA